MDDAKDAAAGKVQMYPTNPYSRSHPGSKMAAVKSYVEANPGKAMMHAALFVAPGPSSRPGLQYGYNTVHRAIKAGLVVGRPGPRGATLLYPAAQ